MIRPLVAGAWLIFAAGVVVTLMPNLFMKIVGVAFYASVLIAVTELD